MRAIRIYERADNEWRRPDLAGVIKVEVSIEV